MWIALGVGATLLLRAGWFDAPLGRDEGGVALVARGWHGGGPFAYGDWFLDRPPLLLALYRLAGDSQVGIRVLGAVAASLIVVLSVLLAVRLAGRAAAPWAAAISAVLASSFAIRSVFTPAELLAAVPSCASVLVLVIALQRRERALGLFAAAGALAVAALLVKQSFGDALVAGVAGLAVLRQVRAAAAYLAGALAVVAGLLVWAWVSDTTLHSVWYAMFGFRLDAVSALSHTGLEGRLSTLGSLFLTSGLALAAVLAAIAIGRILKTSAAVRVALAAWLIAAVVGILLGGSYWPHYLIELVPGLSACAAVVLTRNRWLALLAVCVIAIPVALKSEHVLRSDSADDNQTSAVTIGNYVRDRALPGQTAYVVYAKVNVIYYAGLRDPFPYNWSLMMRAVPGAQTRLRTLLASSGRPTWIVKADSAHSFGLDRSGATARLLKQHYRRLATVCGYRVLLARGAALAPGPPPPTACVRSPGAAAPA